MNTVISNNPLFAPHLLGTPRLSPSRTENFNTERMSGRKRKASDDEQDERMSASPTASPSTSTRALPHASAHTHPHRALKRTRTAVPAGRPLDLARLLETLSADDMRTLLQNICHQNPSIAHEVVTKAPRPSVESALSVLHKYQSAFKQAFPFGNRPSSDYTYNRVRQQMLQLIEAVKDFTPHFLPPNEPQPTVSLTYLDSVTQIIHSIPDWDTYQHNRPKQDAYEDLSHAWVLALHEGAKRGGGFLLQHYGWDQKIVKHHEVSHGRMQEAVDELRANVGWSATASSSSSASSAALDERAAVRQQLFSGTYGQDSIPVGPW